MLIKYKITEVYEEEIMIKPKICKMNGVRALDPLKSRAPDELAAAPNPKMLLQRQNPLSVDEPPFL